MTSPFHSIRWRVQAWHGLILLVVIAAFCFTAWQLAWDTTLRRVDGKLRETERFFFHNIVQAVLPDTKPESRQRLSAAEFFTRLGDKNRTLKFSDDFLQKSTDTAPGFAYYCVFNQAGDLLLRSPNAPAGIEAPPSGSENSPTKELVLTLDGRREARHSSPDGIRSTIGIDITPELSEMRRLAWSLAGTGLAVWLLGLLGGWWISGRVIHPIREISRTATRIANGNLSERIDTRDAESELGQLARVLNDTFSRLHASIEQQKRFTADASHELRTPISILIAETQRVLKRDRSAEEYRDALQVCSDTAARMRRLVESLLLLARQETPAGNSSAQQHEPCDLAEILRDTAAQLAPLAAERHIEIDTSSLNPAPCNGNSSALAIVATNLLSNAIQHHHPVGNSSASTPRIRLETGTSPDNTTVFLIVSDNGPGISTDDLPHIFDRFYRADKARTSTAQSHAGLGLAITRQIVENHNGTITATSTPATGATFTLLLPRN